MAGGGGWLEGDWGGFSGWEGGRLASVGGILLLRAGARIIGDSHTGRRLNFFRSLVFGHGIRARCAGRGLSEL